MSETDQNGAERLLAARNALTLGSALVVTGVLAMLVRLFLPRVLGPGAFGEYRLAEAAAELLFVVLTFGVDLQLRREAALDPSRARGYLSGLTVLRLGVAVPGILATVAFLRATGAHDPVIQLFLLIALAQVFSVLNNSYAAFEHAAGDVGWIARTNLATKIGWALATVTTLFVRPAGLAIAAVSVGVEVARFAWLTWRGVRRHGLAIRPDLTFAFSALMLSLPFFVNTVAHSVYVRIGTAWLGALCSDTELGLYGAASGLASIALIGMPLLSWVLVPSAARAAAHSADELAGLVASALRASLLVFVPLALAFHVGAEFWLTLLFGSAYAPAAPVLRVLAPTFALAYASTVCAIALIQGDRIRAVAGVSLAGVAITLLLDAILIPWGLRTLGEAGGAQGAAWATLGTETIVATALAWMSRKFWWDRSLVRTVGALTGGVVASAVIAWLAPVPGVEAALLALAGFALVVVAAGGVDASDVRFCRRVLTRGRSTGPMPIPAEA